MKRVVQESGIHSPDDVFLAASPDGLVYNKDDQLVDVLEIKCPYSTRNSTVRLKSFFC